MEKKLRGRYTQEFEYFGIKYKAHIREYATFWEGELDEKTPSKYISIGAKDIRGLGLMVREP